MARRIWLVSGHPNPFLSIVAFGEALVITAREIDISVGSLADGAIYRGDVVTGQGDILVEGEEGRIAVGLAYDPRTDQLWVAGGGHRAGARVRCQYR